VKTFLKRKGFSQQRIRAKEEEEESIKVLEDDGAD